MPMPGVVLVRALPMTRHPIARLATVLIALIGFATCVWACEEDEIEGGGSALGDGGASDAVASDGAAADGSNVDQEGGNADDGGARRDGDADAEVDTSKLASFVVQTQPTSISDAFNLAKPGEI